MAKTVKAGETFDVESIERALAGMWQETTARSDGEEAILRARAANFIVFLADSSLLDETQRTVTKLAASHPCRALVLLGERDAKDKDIEVSVSTSCPEKNGSESSVLCCEQITLIASGEFVSELPSAAIPLLIPDLTTFLWWRDEVRVDDEVFEKLLTAADRLIIDSAEFHDPYDDFVELAKVRWSDSFNEVAISDMNWERLTPWRTALANFYDIPTYRDELDQIDRLRIDYVASGRYDALPSQVVMTVGWLASRLKWKFKSAASGPKTSETFQFGKDDWTIQLELNGFPSDGSGGSPDVSAIHGLKHGRIFRLELQRAAASQTGDEPTSFVVHRSEDGQYLDAFANVREQGCPGCRVRFRNLTTAQLLSREMEILTADKVYEEAITFASRLGR